MGLVKLLGCHHGCGVLGNGCVQIFAFGFKDNRYGSLNVELVAGNQKIAVPIESLRGIYIEFCTRKEADAGE